MRVHTGAGIGNTLVGSCLLKVLNNWVNAKDEQPRRNPNSKGFQHDMICGIGHGHKKRLHTVHLCSAAH